MEEKIIQKLFKLANKSLKKNEFPVSAIIYDNDKIISVGYNIRNKSKKTIDHAEIIAITKANKKLKTWNLQGKNMIITLEPCPMCTAVIKEARLDNVYYIIPRYQYKKAYKKTLFKEYNTNLPEKQKYINDISSFFNNKR